MAQNTIFYSHSQTSAPALSSGGGTLLTVLDACLVNGFNSQTISTLSVTSNVATATFSGAHGYQLYDVIAISGANESQFNSNWMVKTVPDSTTLTFDITTADVTATGTITCKIAPLGWEIAYTGTNLRAYRSPSGFGNRRYLRVNDVTSSYSTVQMYKTMSDINTGDAVGSAQYWMKVRSTDAAGNREWLLVGNKKMFYWMPSYHKGADATFYVFGDYLSAKAGDTKNTIIIANNSSNESYPWDDYGTSASVNRTGDSDSRLNHTICESIFSTAPGIAIRISNWVVTSMGVAKSPSPNPYTGGFDFEKIYLFEKITSPSTLYYFIGTLPGLLTPLQCTYGIMPLGYKFSLSNGIKCIAAKLSTYVGPVNIAFTLNDWE